MFIGHFGPASFFARQAIPLWHCFVAVQVVDYIFFPLVLLGIEHVEVVPNATAVNHFETIHIGYSHSLASAVLLSLLAYVIYPLLNKSAKRGGALLIAGLVFSHWILDLVAHLPDLPLWPHGHVVGMGLWAFFWPSLIVESALFVFGAIYFYIANRDRVTRLTPYALVLLITTAIALAWIGFTGSVPRDLQSGMIAAPFVLMLLTLGAFFVDQSLQKKDGVSR